jgi:hypothetical protein
MNSSTIDISFVTINYNSSSHTIELVKSIVCHTSLIFEIIVVDNASQAEDYSALKNYCDTVPQVTLVRNRINAGFASGNMLGVNYALGKYYFFINNDCKLLNDAGKILKDFLDQNAQCTLATGAIYDEKGGTSSSFKQFPHPTKQLLGNSVQRLFGAKKFPSNKTTLTRPTEVEVCSGSCMFFRADGFCNLGGFDTSFFLYCEEEDICKRVWDKDGVVFYLPEAKIFHAGGGSSKENLLLEKEFYISYLLLFSKHYGQFQNCLLRLALLLKLFFRIFKRQHGLNIFLFVLGGAKAKHSLRYKQKVEKHND